MELKNKLSVGAIEIDHLLEEYFDRDKIHGFCQACPKYAKNWSCPPHQFDERLFLKEFKYMHLIGRQYQVPKNDIRKIRDPQEIGDYCTEKMQMMKVMTWKALLEIENEVGGVIGLIPGDCPICETQGMACARIIDKPCRFPNLMRYSLESLGFNVTDLIKYEVGMSMKWSENHRLPDQLSSVAAILCNCEIPQETLKKYFPDQKKSWVRYDETQLDTKFETAVDIKSSETLHGGKSVIKTAVDVDNEEIAAYKPRKSWLHYKAEPDEDLIKKSSVFKVTVQGEDDLKMPFESQAIESDERSKRVKVDEENEEDDCPEMMAIKEEPLEETAAEIEEEIEEEKYKWLGFKGQIDDDDSL